MLSWNKDQWSRYIAVQARAIAIRQRFSIGAWYSFFFVNFLFVGLGTFFIDSKYEACKAAENSHAASNQKSSIKITTCVVQPAWITADVLRHYFSFLHQNKNSQGRGLVVTYDFLKHLFSFFTAKYKSNYTYFLHMVKDKILSLPWLRQNSRCYRNGHRIKINKYVENPSSSA